MSEFRDLERAPSLGGSDQRTEHQLQDSSLAERIRDDLETTAFLDKQAFKQIRRPDGPSMRHRESQVGDAGFEVVHQARDRAVVFAAVVGHDAGREFAQWPGSAPDLGSCSGRARVGFSQRSKYRDHRIALEFAAMRSRIAYERLNELQRRRVLWRTSVHNPVPLLIGEH